MNGFAPVMRHSLWLQAILMKRIMHLRLLVLAGVLLAAAGCTITVLNPEDSFALEPLLLDESVLPPGATAGPVMETADHHGAIGHLMRSIYVGTGGANHEVYRYTTDRRAAREFERMMNIGFPRGKHYTPWAVPAELRYQSPVADQFYLACANHGSNLICVAIGQYDEYFIRFSTLISPDSMTYADLERAFRAIDERMAQCLGK